MDIPDPTEKYSMKASSSAVLDAREVPRYSGLRNLSQSHTRFSQAFCCGRSRKGTPDVCRKTFTTHATHTPPPADNNPVPMKKLSGARGRVPRLVHEAALTLFTAICLLESKLLLGPQGSLVVISSRSNQSNLSPWCGRIRIFQK